MERTYTHARERERTNGYARAQAPARKQVAVSAAQRRAITAIVFNSKAAMRNRQNHASHTRCVDAQMQTPLKRARTSCAHAYTRLQVATYQSVFSGAHELVELHCALICKLLPINAYNPHSNAHKMAATDRKTDSQTQTHTACRKQDCERKHMLRFDGQFIILPSRVSKTYRSETNIVYAHSGANRLSRPLAFIPCVLAWPHQMQKLTRMPTGAISLCTTLFFAYVHASTGRPEIFSYS